MGAGDGRTPAGKLVITTFKTFTQPGAISDLYVLMVDMELFSATMTSTMVMYYNNQPGIVSNDKVLNLIDIRAFFNLLIWSDMSTRAAISAVKRTMIVYVPLPRLPYYASKSQLWPNV